MADLFFQGGWFMVPLTVLLLIIIAIAIYRAIQISKNEIPHETIFRHQLAKIKSVGLFAFILGIFDQFLGIYQMFSAIGAAQHRLLTTLLLNGAKVSIIPFLYGAILFLFSYILWFGLDTGLSRMGSSDYSESSTNKEEKDYPLAD